MTRRRDPPLQTASPLSLHTPCAFRYTRRYMNRQRLLSALSTVRAEIALIGTRSASPRTAIDRARAELDALAFHAEPGGDMILVTLIGGTGTGKSTLTNRLLGAAGSEVTASNFRRTFTAGPVAITNRADRIPQNWLGLTCVPAPSLPARGQDAALVVVEHGAPLLERILLLDTPDVDGDQPAHHALADRSFRWSQVLVFLVTPEKYQMTELMPYYRLSQRYGLPTLFVMNKAEDRGVAEDFEKQLKSLGFESPRVFIQPRDDSTFVAPERQSIADLRHTLETIQRAPTHAWDKGLTARANDVAARVNDQVIEPLRELRKQADAAIGALREMRAAESGIDVDPMTRQLRKRMQQRSILYLVGPERMLERLKQTPALLARLPRSTLDLFRGKPSAPVADSEPMPSKAELPNFPTMVADQFAVAQEKIADVLRTQCPGLVGDDWRIDRAQAGAIVDEEMESLRKWLEERWNKDPRDTAMILKLVNKLPGGERLTKLSESAPYLLVIACGLHHLAWGGMDLVVIGGFSLAAWIGGKLNDEVAARTRLANANIDRRFAELVRQQGTRAISWLNDQIPTANALDAMALHLDDLTSLS